MVRRALIAAAVVLLAALVLSVPVAGAQSFDATVSAIPRDVRAEMRGVSWRPGCPVGFASLRLIEMTHRTPDGGVATGRMIVHADVADEVVRIFRTLYRLRFPIERMVLIDAYDGDDWESIEANNTSAFNCRKATGSGSWSNHAYGYAIDVNPIQNPYVSGGQVYHDASWRYIDRSKRRSPMMILAGDRVVRAFEREGWGWGGYWTSPKDYQHFSVNGR